MFIYLPYNLILFDFLCCGCATLPVHFDTQFSGNESGDERSNFSFSCWFEWWMTLDGFICCWYGKFEWRRCIDVKRLRCGRFRFGLSACVFVNFIGSFLLRELLENSVRKHVSMLRHVRKYSFRRGGGRGCGKRERGRIRCCAKQETQQPDWIQIKIDEIFPSASHIKRLIRSETLITYRKQRHKTPAANIKICILYTKKSSSNADAGVIVPFALQHIVIIGMIKLRSFPKRLMKSSNK